MTVYARSDVAAVSISQEHGGCGEVHSRPVVQGVPARLWALTCHSCEDVLRSDAHWAGTPHTVPETPDEVAIRNDAEKKNQVELHVSNAHALAELAKLGELPTAMAQALAAAFSPLIAGGNAERIDAPVFNHLCRNGHSNHATAKFCGECGADMRDAVNKKPVAALDAPESPSPAETEEPVTPVESESEAPAEPPLEELSYTQLKDIAKARNLEIAPSKAKQLEIVKKALEK